MFDLSVKSEFSAAHSLRGYEGKCESLHVHNWRVEVIVVSERLNKVGIASDFKKLKKIINAITNEFDHYHLNKLSFFKKVNPTSENIARYIFIKIKPRLKRELVSLKSVSVWESESSKATYYE